jgi:hypothetical protein
LQCSFGTWPPPSQFWQCSQLLALWIAPPLQGLNTTGFYIKRINPSMFHPWNNLVR